MKSSIISYLCGSQKNIIDNIDLLNQWEFDEACDLTESSSESGSLSPTLCTIYAYSCNESLLVKNKGNIKNSEKKEFIENLEKQLILSSAKDNSIKMTPWFNNGFENASKLANQNIAKKKAKIRRNKNWNKVRRSITVSPEKWFGPKMSNPSVINKAKSPKKLKKISSSTLKSKRTNFSSSKALKIARWRTRQLNEANNRPKSSFTRLFRIPEISENEGALLTILDL